MNVKYIINNIINGINKNFILFTITSSINLIVVSEKIIKDKPKRFLLS